MIKVGNSLPLIDITTVLNEETSNTSTSEFFDNKKVVLFAVPGAFTPTCSQSHLPGYITNFEGFKDKGVDLIACLSVNDSFVMKAWAQDQNAESIAMIADGNAVLTKALGLEMDTGNFGGIRSQRYAMIIQNGKLTHLNVEVPKAFEVSSAESVLALL
ncbi:peroxiredoxin [Leucothrix arctica]|uniref:Glutathione-dependent peroxiredoxin n=1 Tax=Leucothrix arctica TaxID=1481894 RepID=A0A317C837_9GAMM|nr:peroxiredoxin [Leucothrix arctica]PWQ94786.1 peroxiredoxin [Leucothrix arctica]